MLFIGGGALLLSSPAAASRFKKLWTFSLQVRLVNFFHVFWKRSKIRFGKWPEVQSKHECLLCCTALMTQIMDQRINSTVKVLMLSEFQAEHKNGKPRGQKNKNKQTTTTTKFCDLNGGRTNSRNRWSEPMDFYSSSKLCEGCFSTYVIKEFHCKWHDVQKDKKKKVIILMHRWSSTNRHEWHNHFDNEGNNYNNKGVIKHADRVKLNAYVRIIMYSYTYWTSMS